MNKYGLIGPFAKHIEGMVDYKVSLGYAKETYTGPGNLFDKYSFENHNDAEILSKDIVLEWIRIHNNDGTANFLRSFAKYLISVGEEAYILPSKFTPKRVQYVPHILTDSELVSLFKEIDSYDSNAENVLPFLIPTIYRLIYSCGLRPGEARNLKREHVNLMNGEIFITKAKRNIERIVVMSDDMLSLAKQYATIRDVAFYQSQYFFPNSEGGCISKRWLYDTLLKCYKKSNANSSSKFRVYDLRHQFASTVLNKWIDEKKNINEMLPYLQAYMGHTDIESTAYYIHLLPENISKSSGIDWNSFENIIPEVQ